MGYYVNNDYEEEELRDNPPEKLQIERVMSNLVERSPSDPGLKMAIFK